jgi:hypothetical protein
LTAVCVNEMEAVYKQLAAMSPEELKRKGEAGAGVQPLPNYAEPHGADEALAYHCDTGLAEPPREMKLGSFDAAGLAVMTPNPR